MLQKVSLGFILLLGILGCDRPVNKAPSPPAPPTTVAPSAKPVADHIIREGMGVGGAHLGMTAAEVEATLGKAEHVNKAGDQIVFMSFHKTQNFGIYFGDDGRVRMIIAALQDKSWCTEFDVCLYREGDLAKLKAHHGAKLLRFVDRDGSVTLRLLTDSGDKKVMTEYTPVEERNGVVQVAILYWNGPIDQSSFD